MNTLVSDAPNPETTPGGTLAHYAFEASLLLKVLGHEGRLMVLSHLAEGPKTVSELQALMGAAQPVISSHLARLRYEGLVSFDKEGKTSVYALTDAKARLILEMIGTVFCDGLRGRLG